MCFLKWRGRNSRTKNQIEMDKKQNKLQNVAIEMVLRASDIVKKRSSIQLSVSQSRRVSLEMFICDSLVIF